MTFNPSRFVPFVFKSRQIGWLRPELAARLGAWPTVFKGSAEKVILLQPGELPAIVKHLAHEGFIPGWRNENYRIADLFDIERAAARPLSRQDGAVALWGAASDRWRRVVGAYASVVGCRGWPGRATYGGRRPCTTLRRR